MASVRLEMAFISVLTVECVSRSVRGGARAVPRPLASDAAPLNKLGKKLRASVHRHTRSSRCNFTRRSPGSTGRPSRSCKVRRQFRPESVRSPGKSCGSVRQVPASSPGVLLGSGGRPAGSSFPAGSGTTCAVAQVLREVCPVPAGVRQSPAPKFRRPPKSAARPATSLGASV